MSVLPIVVPLVLLVLFVAYQRRRTTPQSRRRADHEGSWQHRRIRTHPVVISGGLGLFWGLASGGLFVVIARPPHPLGALVVFVAGGLVGFGPIMVYLARRADRTT